MVDFEKLLGKKKLTKPVDPIAIFNDLDKESTIEGLRQTQRTVLKEWFGKHRDKKDIIVKLHTGQGKTLIGLLMLQSSINEEKGPSVYLCPNNYLVTQTVEQAQLFGLSPVESSEDGSLPHEFLNSEAILITTCAKLFNGKSLFGIEGSRREPIGLGAIVMDDAHKCLDIIRENFSIKINRLNPGGSEHPVYSGLRNLFEETLDRQGSGTLTDILHGEDSLMAVPYWSWNRRKKEILELLHKHKDTDNRIKFPWGFLKDRIHDCYCVFSGKGLEIAPRLVPIELVPSFERAQRRIFLSATLTEDAFLVRDLGIDGGSVISPLCSGDIKYSGERLIIMPTVVNPALERAKVISWLSAIAAKHGNFGVVSLVPSNYLAEDWERVGAEVTNVTTLYDCIVDLREKTKQKQAKKVLVLVSQYDGVDLPDFTCRILCLDSLPSYSSLVQSYIQDMRPTSKAIRRQIAQRVEQGIGRAIRGSSDWCIVIITGRDLSNFLSEDVKRQCLSAEAQLQINIGKELSPEIKAGGKQLDAIEHLINQVLNRDAAWKQYYKRKMVSVETKKLNKEYLTQALLERQAETLYQKGEIVKAVEMLQELVDNASDRTDKGWYFQLMATYISQSDISESMQLQLKAHSENGRLFLPETGVQYGKIDRGTSRPSNIADVLKKHENFNSLILDVHNILDKIKFGIDSDLFEEGMDQLGPLLGFGAQRPEKLFNCGPDNLWHIEGKRYWVIECKNMILADRKEISKTEVGQMSNSIAWFKGEYEGCRATAVFAHPACTLARDACSSDLLYSLQPHGIEELKKYVVSFFNSLKDLSLSNPSTTVINEKLRANHLGSEELLQYLTRVKN